MDPSEYLTRYQHYKASVELYQSALAVTKRDRETFRQYCPAVPVRVDVAIRDAIRHYRTKRDAAIKECRQIRDTIGRLSDPASAALVSMFYIDGLTPPAIMSRLDITRRQFDAIHKKALHDVAEMLNA